MHTHFLDIVTRRLICTYFYWRHLPALRGNTRGSKTSMSAYIAASKSPVRSTEPLRHRPARQSSWFLSRVISFSFFHRGSSEKKIVHCVCSAQSENCKKACALSKLRLACASTQSYPGLYQTSVMKHSRIKLFSGEKKKKNFKKFIFFF